MLFESEDAPGYFTSLYQVEYVPKRVRKLFKAKPCPPKFGDNPIMEPHREFLYTEKKNERLHPLRRSESLQNYLDKVRCEHPNLKKFLPRCPPDESLIELEQKKLFRSVYQHSYSKNLDDEDHKESTDIELPENYSLSETLYQKYYRPPCELACGAILKPRNTRKVPDNLGPNEEERKILRIRTGESEYQACINKVGQRVMKEQLFGPPIPVEPPEEHIKGPDSERTICSQIMMNASNKHVLSQVFH